MTKLNKILLIAAVIFIVGGIIVLYMAPSKKKIEKHLNARIKRAKRDQWKYRT